ncbi:MAG TPA: ATP-binding cassette domain-containing protein, partial [Candidatus Polarisedimenticolia bacterium]|nr:ATP-binding cassette domain-containing protein [Candidatus Polarisedimenticolia bacterium]
GRIERAEGLRVVYFDQTRESLDPDLSLKRALAPAGDSVIYRDQSLHVASWAKRFLFRFDQLETPVSRLSGGERARIVLARMMLHPADLLVLDEPTNDLDIPALEVLEESLLDFPGAVVLVTHDRHLLDRVSTQILALDGRGAAEHFADYAQWEAGRRRQESARREEARPVAGKPAKGGGRRLTYQEQREWDGMEGAVLVAENRMAEARRLAEDPAIATDAVRLQERLEAVTDSEREVERLYTRWAELEAKRSS